MKILRDHAFDARQCAAEIGGMRALLGGGAAMERRDIKPFFENARHLCAFIGGFFPNISAADALAYEFEIGGDFCADIVLGKRATRTFCMIELEDASPRSVFSETERSTPEWGRRFEHGFSQLVDWFYMLDDLQGSEKLAGTFGHGHIRFYGLLVVGRSADMAPRERNRLRWRSERVLVNSHPIHCITYDELLSDLEDRLPRFREADDSLPDSHGS